MKQWQNFSALSKVKTGIETLAVDVAVSIESLLDLNDPGDAALVGRCHDNLQSIAGVMRSLEYEDFALLVDEMDELLDAAFDGGDKLSDEGRTESRQLLYTAVTDLPALMEGVLSGRISHWHEYSLLFNRIRKARNRSLVFSSQTLLASSEVDFRELFRTSPAQMLTLIEKQIAGYEEAKRLILQEGDLPRGVARLHQVFGKLEILARDFRLGTLWGLCMSLVESLPEEKLEAGHPILKLLLSFSGVLKAVSTRGGKILSQNIPESVLEKVLDALVRCEGKSERMAAIKHWYNLDLELSKGYRRHYQNLLVGFSRKGASVKTIKLLVDDVKALGESVHQHTVQGEVSGADLRKLVTALGKIRGCTFVLDMPDLVAILDVATKGCGEIPREEPVDAAAAQQCLEILVQALYKSEIILQGRAEELERAVFVNGKDGGRENKVPTGATLNIILEVIKNLEQVVMLVNAYVEGGYDNARLEGAQKLLHEGEAALASIGLDKAASFAGGCRDYLGKAAAFRQTPKEKGFHAFAHLLINMLLYLEQVSIGRAGDLILLVEESEGLRREIVNEAALPDEKDGGEAAVGDLEPSIVQSAVIAEDEVDDDIKAVFLEESSEILVLIAEHYARLTGNPGDRESLLELRRGFHTLKGSGRMVEAAEISEAARRAEDLLNGLLGKQEEADESCLKIIGDTLDEVRALIQDFAGGASAGERAEDGGEDEADNRSAGRDDVFIADAQRLVDRIRALLDPPDGMDETGIAVTSTSLQIPVHTLYGNSRVAKVDHFAKAVGMLEEILQDRPYEKLRPDLLPLVAEFCRFADDVIQDFRSNGPFPESEHARAEARRFMTFLSFRKETPHTSMPWPGVRNDGEGQDMLLRGFLGEAKSSHALIRESFAGFLQHPDSKTALVLAEQFNLLQGAAASAEQTVIDGLSFVLKRVYGELGAGRFGSDERLLDLLGQCHTRLDEAMSCLNRGEEPAAEDDLPGTLEAALEERLGRPETPVKPPSREEGEESLVWVFLAEADDILQDLDDKVAAWRSRGAGQASEEILRSLHTLKGSAALAGNQASSESAHRFESLLIDGRPAPGSSHDAFFKQVDGCLQDLHTCVADFRANLQGQSDTQPSTQATSECPEEPVAQAPVYVRAVKQSSETTDSTPGRTPAPAAPGAGTARQEPALEDFIRVSGKHMKSLLNDADEIGIARTRAEALTEHIHSALGDMDEILGRLRASIQSFEEQGRVLASGGLQNSTVHRDKEHGEDGFDTLEMDRYTQLQEVGLSLREDYEDLHDVRTNLLERIKEVDGVLLEQLKPTNRLQEGLLSSHMVPFAGIVPRLERLTRQVAAELDKDVTISFSNPEGKIDRGILQAVVVPLEHMIRNAIDHGVESHAERASAGKSASARILVRLYRQGAGINLEISDDGRGINIESVKARARAMGLIETAAEISDQEACQFILRSGFSTSDQVSRISGRGVGLDVVHKEIGLAGGDLEIYTRPGQGTTFRIRLPLTSSLNRALLFSLAGSQYVMLLDTLDGIILESTDKLKRYYRQDKTAVFQYADKSYELAYLGNLLDLSSEPTFAEGDAPSPAPLLLVSGKERNLALQVDSISGSRECVVKSLGGLFASLSGITGGVILGDGSVAVVIDPTELADNYVPHRDAGFETVLSVTSKTTQKDADPVKTVLVVDDSITVRKITAAILKRNGMNVLLAKNGMEAVDILQNTLPDVILLDIEMPRMDGFELASYIRRQHGKVRHIPIIMITSRIGDKHRSRAREIGVDSYMCKPFQEENLLNLIGECH